VHFDVVGSARFWPPGRHVADAAWVSALAERCEAGAQRGDDLGREQARLLVWQILLHLHEEATRPPHLAGDAALQRIAAEIQRHPGKPWPVDELARRVHLSRSQFNRRFRALTGLPPTRYVIRTRVQRARQLLRESDMPVGRIGEALGYEDVAFFSRQYKRVTGRSPIQDRGSVQSRPSRMSQSGES
jgi:AraC family transcriptional regulator, arabinose operon regulatory protein